MSACSHVPEKKNNQEIKKKLKIEIVFFPLSYFRAPPSLTIETEMISLDSNLSIFAFSDKEIVNIQRILHGRAE